MRNQHWKQFWTKPKAMERALTPRGIDTNEESTLEAVLDQFVPLQISGEAGVAALELSYSVSL